MILVAGRQISARRIGAMLLAIEFSPIAEPPRPPEMVCSTSIWCRDLPGFAVFLRSRRFARDNAAGSLASSKSARSSTPVAAGEERRQRLDGLLMGSFRPRRQ